MPTVALGASATGIMGNIKVRYMQELRVGQPRLLKQLPSCRTGRGFAYLNMTGRNS